MAVSTENALSGPYLANGVTTAFPFTFTAAGDDEVAVLVRDAAGVDVAPGGYAVSRGAASGGTVMFTTAPANGLSVIIYSDPLFTQDTEFEDGSAWLASPVNSTNDRSAIRDQALRRDISRSLKVPIGGVAPDLPLPESWAGQFFVGLPGGEIGLSGGTGADSGLRVDLAGTGGAAMVGTADGAGLQTALNAKATYVATRTAMKALNVTRHTMAFMDESAGRRGWFVLRTGTPATDTLEGLYVVSDTAGYYWERIWDGSHAQPEWFGALPADSSNAACDANLAAFAAVLALAPVLSLSAVDYWIRATWVVNTPYRTIEGVVRSDGYGSSGTRIICKEATVGILKVGPSSSPGPLANYTRNITFRDFSVGYSVAPTPNATHLNNVRSVSAAWLLDCTFENVTAWEPLVGFFLYGTVATHLIRCKAFRSTAFGANDSFYGFWVRGDPPVSSGGNPSLYLTECKIEDGTGGVFSTRVGIYADADAADLFIDQSEGVGLEKGIYYNTTGSASMYGQQNIHIRNAVMDQCSSRGVEINGLSATGMVNIQGGYFQSPVSCVYLHDGAGTITVDGAEVVNSVISGRGIQISNQSGVVVTEATTILDCGYAVTVEGTCNDGLIEATINNPNVGNGTLPAISFDGGQLRWHVAPAIKGKATAWSQGVVLAGSACDKFVIDPTRVVAASCTGSVKTRINSNDNLAAGYYTSAGVSGTNGSGILLTGITA